MRVTSRIKSLLLLAAALFAACVPSASATVTYYVGKCAGSPHYKTISAALAATPAPDVVEVCPGPYPEQIVITKAVTLEGIFTANADQVFITVPTGGFTTNGPADCLNVQVCVDSAIGTVNISNITVDGHGNGVLEGNPVVGILYFDSSGTADHIETRFQEGTLNGMGVEVNGNANSVTIKNSNLHGFDGVGIFAIDNSDFGNQLTVSIERNTVVANPGAQSGIETEAGASVSVTGNVVSGPGVPAGSSCTISSCIGMSIEQAAVGSISNNTIVGSAEVGIQLVAGVAGSTMSVTSNTILDISGDGIEILYKTGGPLQSNIIVQARNGIDFVCNAVNNVSSNSISAIHSLGLANVPSGLNSPNTYYNVPTLYSSSGC